jgi:indole-3-glycerol phosphate synthase
MKATDFLSRILESKRAQLARESLKRNVEDLRRQALEARSNAKPHQLRAALLDRDRVNIIAEIKRCSPSKGVIRSDIVASDAALAYTRGGAAAISVLTEEEFFKGSLDDLRAVRAAVQLPLLRKDFIIDPCQVYESAVVGADAVLLIVSALDDEMLSTLLRITEGELNLDALVEVHSIKEMKKACAFGATLIGVNNRDLHSFDVSIEISVEVAREAPPNVTLVSESGLLTSKQLRGLRALGFSGFLIGESLIRADRADEALIKLIRETQV